MDLSAGQASPTEPWEEGCAGSSPRCVTARACSHCGPRGHTHVEESRGRTARAFGDFQNLAISGNREDSAWKSVDPQRVLNSSRGTGRRDQMRLRVKCGPANNLHSWGPQGCRISPKPVCPSRLAAASGASGERVAAHPRRAGLVTWGWQATLPTGAESVDKAPLTGSQAPSWTRPLCPLRSLSP